MDHEAACRGVESLAPAADRQGAVQHVEALIVPVMHMQRRPGADAGLKDAQGAAGRLPRGLQAGIARQASASRNYIASQEVGHGIHDRARAPALAR